MFSLNLKGDMYIIIFIIKINLSPSCLLKHFREMKICLNYLTTNAVCFLKGFQLTFKP